MKAKALLITLVLWGAGAVSFAQNPHLGTWKLNEAKSNIPAEMPKFDTVTYTAEGDNVKVTTEGTGRDGQPTRSEWTGKFDGKDYPTTGDASTDMRSYRMVNDRTLTLTTKKDGKTTSTGRIVVAPDGKSRTVTLRGTDSSGKEVTETAFYDKQ